MANVEQAGRRTLAKMAATTNQVDRIYPLITFQEKARDAMCLTGGISESDLAILLRHLARDKGAIVYDSEAVKFKSPGEQLTDLSMEDKTIASLKMLMVDLSAQVALLTNKISNLTAAAQKAIDRKDRISASAALKSRKLIEITLVQRTDTLSQVEEVFHKIGQAHDQIAMVKVMEGSASVLRNLLTQTGGVEKVEQIVEDLKDEMQQVDEIGTIIETGRQTDDTDEEVVDEELEEMIQKAKAKAEEQEAQRTQQILTGIESKNAALPERREALQITDDAGNDALKRVSLHEDPARFSASTSKLPEAAPEG